MVIHGRVSRRGLLSFLFVAAALLTRVAASPGVGLVLFLQLFPGGRNDRLDDV